MDNEATPPVNAGGDGAPPAGTTPPAGVASLFGTPPAGTGDGTPPPDPNAIPQNYLGADGQPDPAKLWTALRDTKSWGGEKAARVAELERMAGTGVPETPEEYWATMKLEELKAAAPKAYAGTAADEAALKALMTAAHKTGIPLAKAQAMAGEFYGGLNGIMPDLPAPKTPEERRAAAAGALANGEVVSSDVKAWLQNREQAQPFAEGQMKVIDSMLQTPDGLSLLWRLSRQAGSAAPPTLDASIPAVDLETRRRQLSEKLGTLDEEEFRKNKASIMAEWRRLNPEAA